MRAEVITYRWACGVKLVADREAGAATLETPRGPVQLSQLDDGQLAMLHAFDGLGTNEAGLLRARGDATGMEGAAWVHLMVNRLLQLGVVDRVIGDPPLATVEVIGNNYQPSGRTVPDGARVRLSRFAYLRQDGDTMLLESPRARVRLVAHTWAATAILGLLGQATRVDDIVWPNNVDADVALTLVDVLFREGFLEPGDPPDVREIPEARALSEWEFHDLLFHARSRQGLHRYPYGGTYRFEDDRPPLPAVKELTSDVVVALPEPDLDAIRAADVPFAEVVESRRSLRVPGPAPLTANALGEFLYRTARVRARRTTEHEEVSNRPYPGGGADYELEIYPIVHRVKGVEPGLYWYQPVDHALVRLGDLDGLVARFAADVVFKAPPAALPDVLFAVTARFGRLTYKYQSIPYAVALKDLGVLYQTFYLTATAMGLAPCAVGGGDSDVFAAATGLSPYLEPQIGEFMLSSRDPDEHAATTIPGVH